MVDRGKRDEGYGGNLTCSFCGKSQKEVKKLIAGPTVYICDECISLCNDIIAEEQDKDSRTDGAFTVPRPAEIKDVLDEYVIGQERAKKALAETGVDVSALRRRIDGVLAKTLIAAQGHVTQKYGQHFRRRNACFELFGFDVMLDEQVRNGSLCAQGPAHEEPLRSSHSHGPWEASHGTDPLSDPPRGASLPSS